MSEGLQDSEQELADLFASEEPVEVAVGKHVFRLRHLGVRDLIIAGKALQLAHAAMFDDAQAETVIAQNVDQLEPLLATATGIPAATIAKLRPGVQLQLFAAILHVNRDFFVQCFAMKYGETAKLALAMSGLGEPPSNS